MIDDLSRPYLKSTTQLLDSDQGVFFYGPGGSILVKAPGAQRAIRRLCRAFDGALTTGELRARLGAAGTRLMDTLTAQLVANGMMLLHEGPGPDEGLSPDAPFASTIGYLRDHVPAFGAAFNSWRATDAVLAGRGRVLTSAAQALVESGIGRIAVIVDPSDECAADLATLREFLAHRTGCILEQPSSIVLAQDALRQSNATLAMFLSDDLRDDDPLLQALRGRDCGQGLIAGVLKGTAIVLHPETSLHDASERLREGSQIDAMLDATSPIFHSMCGTLAALTALNMVTGVGSGDIRSRMLHLTNALDIGWRTVMPEDAEAPEPPILHPAEKVAPRVNPPSPFEALLDKFAPAFDTAIGPFLSRDAGELPQMPLSLDRVTLRLPQSLCLDDVTHVAWGLTVDDAGMHVLRGAVECYLRMAAGHAGEKSFHADFDATAWRHRARLSAIFSAPALIPFQRSLVVDDEQVDDLTIRMLGRMSRIYFGEIPATALTLVPGLNAFRSESIMLDGRSATGFADNPRDAVIESLGGVVGARQWGAPFSPKPTGAQGARTDLSPSSVESTIAAARFVRGCEFEESPMAVGPFWEALGVAAGWIRVRAVEG